MSNSRYILNPDTWKKLVDRLFPKKQDSTKKSDRKSDPTSIAVPIDGPLAHCHIPVCIGYKERKSADQLFAMANGCIQQNLTFTFYLSPKDFPALVKFLEECKEFVEQYRSQIKVLCSWQQEPADLSEVLRSNKLTRWRETEEFKTASRKYEEYRNNQEHLGRVAQIINDDVSTFWQRFKQVPIPEIPKHIVEEVKDCASFMTLEGAQQDRVNVLMYDHDLTKSMLDLFDHCRVLGYKEPLVFCKYSLQPNPEFIQTAPQPKLPPDSSSSKRVLEATQPRAIKPDAAIATPALPQGDDESAFERALVFYTTKGTGRAVDSKATAELLVNIHRIEKRVSPSSSPEDKYAEYAHDIAPGHEEDLVAYSIPLERNADVVAVGMVTEDDPSKVRKLNLSSDGAVASFRRDSIFPAKRSSDNPAPATAEKKI